MDIRKGPWTQEEDTKLRNYVNIHGEGHWSSLSLSAGLNRTGKSCRLRWLNYLKPNVRRGNITLEEQLLILELNLLMGNRWSKIAKYLPGRTDNEIKNYWRTKVKKQAKQLKCDVTSQKFKDTLRYVWMPRLVEQIQLTSSCTSHASEAQPINTADHSTSINTISQHPVTDPSLADPPINIELPARKFMDSANYCYDLFGNNEIYNCFQDGSIYCTESVAAPNTDCCASGERQPIQDSKNLLSGDDSLELLPQYYDIWDLQQQIYDDVYFN